MITSVNMNNTSDYESLFELVSLNINNAKNEAISGEDNLENLKGYAKIYSILSDPSFSIYWTTNDKGEDIISISSLELYFGIIQNLIEIDPKFGILPLDEPFFEIDANSRTISIPKNFSVQVQGDESAETIYFKIARYFDTVDLYNQTVVIRYELPDGTKVEAEPWITIIEEKSGDVVFGWALSKMATSQVGNLKFAIQFYSLNEKNEKSYIFNTLSTEIPIKRSLQIDQDTVFEEDENNREAILSRFKNGYISGIVNVREPEIGYSNLKDNEYYYIDNKFYDDKNSYQLLTTAVSPDAGDISYVWYRIEKAAKRGTPVDSSKVELISADGTYIGTLNNGEIDQVITIFLDGTNLTSQFNIFNGNIETFLKHYYCYREEGEGSNKVKVRINANDINLEGETEFKILLSSCKADEAGKYYCAITNRTGLQEKSKFTLQADFPYPIKPEEKEELFTKREGYDGEAFELTFPQVEIKNTARPIDTNKLQYKYTIKYYEDPNNTNNFTEKVVADTNTFEVDATGKYVCAANTKLNGTESEASNLAAWMVVGPQDLGVSVSGVIENNNGIKYVDLGGSVTFTIDPEYADNFDAIKYEIKPDANAENTVVTIPDKKYTFNPIHQVRHSVTITGITGSENPVNSKNSFTYEFEYGKPKEAI